MRPGDVIDGQSMRFSLSQGVQGLMGLNLSKLALLTPVSLSLPGSLMTSSSARTAASWSQACDNVIPGAVNNIDFSVKGNSPFGSTEHSCPF